MQVAQLEVSLRFGSEGVFLVIEGLPDAVASLIVDFASPERTGPLLIAHAGTLRAYWLARTFHFLNLHDYIEGRQTGILARAI